MTLYHYVALRNGKDVVKGDVDAFSHKEVRAVLREQGLIATKIYSDKEKTEVVDKQLKTEKLKKLSLKEKIDFTSIFHTLNISGVPIIETLVFMENDSSSKNVRIISRELRKMIVGGATFADAVAKHGQIFDNVYIGLTKAGEDSGEMDKTLDRITTLLKKQMAIKSKVTGALLYPCFVVVLSIVVIIVMLTFVFPEFQKMFNNLGKTLPWTTQACIDAGIFIRHNWYYLLAGVILLAVALKFASRSIKCQTLWDKFMLKLPLLQELMKFASLANFIAVLFVAYEAGIPIVDCMYLSNLTISNIILRQAASTATIKIQQGQSLSSALRATGVFPKMLTFMIAAGEQSGRLGEMLNYCSKYIDNELDKIIDSMTKLIEPLMLIFIGGIVLFMAASLYLPLFQSYDF